MPKRAPYLLQWSKSAQVYELFEDHGFIPIENISENAAWFARLQNISSFAFHSRSGAHYTVRKEHIQKNGPYWYGYRSFQRRTVKRYLGRTTNLSLERLEEVAAGFMDSALSHEAESSRRSSPLPSSPLLFSRFDLPRLPLVLIERPRLFAKLDTWRSQKLTLLWAPTGFGKTTLVNSWLRQRVANHHTPHVAWVSLETNDNDPAHFWHSLIGACQVWQEEIGQTALAGLQPFSTLQPPFASAPLEMPLKLLLNDLAKRVSEGILILDDYHTIIEPRLHEMLTFFIEHLPSHLHVMILTRTMPPLPLVHWRARGDMQELSRTDLRFSLEETATFLQHTTTSPLPEHVITQLDALLEGWPAGLRLLVMAGQMMPDGVERQLSLWQKRLPLDSFGRQLLEYILSEVLAAQPEPLQLFLLQTSELPRLTGPLCDAVTDRQNSGALLETIERAGLFLEARDEAEPWYRYAPLWASALQIEARRRLGAEALRVIARHASLWYEQHALAGEAIEAALRAHDVERAGMLIEHFGVLGQRYELQTLRGWLAELPDTIVYAHPALCLYVALTLQFQQEQVPPLQTARERIETLLQRAEEGWRSQGKLVWVGLVYALRALSASLQGTSPQTAVTCATQALTLLSAGNLAEDDAFRPAMLEWRTLCLGMVAAAAMHQGRFDEAQQYLREALVLSQERSNQQFLDEIYLRLGTICMILGELHQANEYYRQALSIGRAQEKDEDSMQALLGLAQLAFEWNDLQALEERIDEVLELTRKLGQESNEKATYFLALLCSARGQHAAAAFRLASLLAHLQATPTQDAQELLPAALALQIHLQLAGGDYLAAQRNLTLVANSAPTLSFLQQMTINILQARLQLAQGKTDTALLLLEDLHQVAQEKRLVRSQIEIQLLLALTLAARKEKDRARRWLQQALSLSHRQGFLRVFLSAGEPLAHVLSSLLPGIREKALRAYGQMILRTFTRGGIPSLPTSAPGSLPLEPLSPQEQSVLQLLVAGRTNPEIARELIISVNTVKDHVKHLYRKLGVSKRLEAYEAARHLEQF